MPFIKKDDGTTVWKEPSSEDIVHNRRDIYEVEESTKFDKELNQELRDKIEEATKYLVSSNRGIIPHTNRNIYSCLRSIISNAPGLVDIVFPVYNSIHIAAQAIEKVLERTYWPYRIYIVDDASDSYTKARLQQFAADYPDKITLIMNKKNKGFAASVNAGIKAGNGKYVCLLNSDVLVTNMWLTKMVLAAEADPKNQIVCPATNNTAVVNIPLSQGASYLAMNHVFEKFAIRNAPEILPSGFCFLFRRSLINKIGYINESYTSYGEDTQYWWDTITYTENGVYPGYRAVLADDAYVMHERTSSFAALNNDAYKDLRDVSSRKFHELNPNYRAWSKTYNAKKAIGYLRNPIPPQIINDRKVKYRVAWVVHETTRCGGMAYIADIVNELIEQGVDAKVCLIKRKPESTTEFVGELRVAPIVFEDYTDFLTNFQLKAFRKGLVFASTVELSSVVRALADNYTDITPILHCQSYEPDLVNDLGLVEKIRQHFHLLPNIVTNAKWITETFQKEYNITPFATVNPGVNIDMFYPREREKGDERPTVMIPVSDKPWRGLQRVMQLIPQLEAGALARGIDLRILLYGVAKNPIHGSNAIALGSIPPIRLASILGTEVDLFVEPSISHSYGLPALEAMASGVPVVSWDNKGINEYGNKDNCIILSSNSPTNICVNKVLDLLTDHASRKTLSTEAFKVRESHSRKDLVRNFIQAIEKKFNLAITPRRIVMVVPHMRKHGGPTTMISLANQLASHGHNVSITTLYSDINHEVARMTDLPIDINPQNFPKCDVAIVNSDNPMCPGIMKLGQVKKKVMLALSLNPRFKQLEEEGRQQPWDAVVCSSDWLKSSMEKVPSGWNYPPRKAYKIGWWHYGHETFAKAPTERTYGDGVSTPLTIATLIHQHPLKGSQEAVAILGKIKDLYKDQVRVIGIGEVDPKKFQISIDKFAYSCSPTREELADIFQRTDIWLGCSRSEGLGRLGLEAMSASVAPVLSQTGAEYVEEGVNCLSFPVGDIDAAVAQLQKLIENVELRRSLSEQAFRTAKKYADSTSTIENLENVIKALF